jgi:hypothetical protein
MNQPIQNHELDFADILERISEIQHYRDTSDYQMHMQDFIMDLRKHANEAIPMLQNYQQRLELEDEEPPIIDVNDTEFAELFPDETPQAKIEGFEDLFKPLTKRDIEQYQEMRSKKRTIEMIKKIRKALEVPLD